MAEHYVVYVLERLRDGREEYAKIASSIEEAEEIIKKWKDSFGACNMQFRLFKLGEEIPLKEVTTKEKQPDKEITKLVVDTKVKKSRRK